MFTNRLKPGIQHNGVVKTPITVIVELNRNP